MIAFWLLVIVGASVALGYSVCRYTREHDEHLCRYCETEYRRVVTRLKELEKR